MSVVEKFKAVSEVAGEIGKEKPRITYVSDCLVTLENYESLKHFDSDEILIEFVNFDVRLIGQELVIESFTPMRITLKGKIIEMSFISSFTVDEL